MDIWQKEIQQLIHSKYSGNNILGFNMVDDKRSVLAWYYCDESQCDKVDLPELDGNLADRLDNKLTEVVWAGDFRVDGDELDYLIALKQSLYGE